MPDIDKVIDGLEHCKGLDCGGCSYNGECIDQCPVFGDAVEIIKAQQKQPVLSMDELLTMVGAEKVIHCKDCKNWMDDLVYDDGSCFCPMLDLRTDPGFFCAGGERKKE